MEKLTASFIKQHREYICALLDGLYEAKEIAKESEKCRQLYSEYINNIISEGHFIFGVINGHHYIRDNFVKPSPIILTTRCKAISKISNKWVYGNILETDDKVQIVDSDLQYHEVEPSTVCQFFGRHDINSREVFTGDILLYPSLGCRTYYQVCYDEHSARYVGKNEISGTIPVSEILHSAEVVGNIHMLNVIDPDRI